MSGLQPTNMHFSLIMRIFGYSNNRPVVVLNNICIYMVYKLNNNIQVNILQQPFIYFSQIILLLKNYYINNFFNSTFFMAQNWLVLEKKK